MRSVIIFIIILSVAGFRVAAYVLHSDRSSDKMTQATKLSDKLIIHDKKEQVASNADAQLAQLNKKVEHIENKVDNLARVLQLAQISTQLPTDNSVDPMRNHSIEADKYFTAEQGTSNEHHAELEKRFAAEFTDLAWVNRMDIEFQTSLNRLSDFGLKNTQMIRHECRATLCNAEFEHGKEENPQLLALALNMPEVERINIVPAISDDGSPISKVYLFREGFASAEIKK